MNVAKLPAIQFYVGDWMKDAGVRSVSFAARGLWIDMLCLMSECTPRGYLALNGKPLSPSQVARMTGGEADEVSRLIQELESAGVFSTDRHGVIYSRRMIKDEELRDVRRKCGKMGGNPNLLNQVVNQNPTTGVNQKPTPSSSSSSSSSFMEGGTGTLETDDLDTQVRKFIGTSPLMPVWNKGEHDALRKLVGAVGWHRAEQLLHEVRADPKVISPSKVALGRAASEQANAAIKKQSMPKPLTADKVYDDV